MKEKHVLELKNLSKAQRDKYIIELINEQVILQRTNLNFWKELTNQPAQIDTGYIGQHLVSLVTRIKGGGFRGKGLDLEEGSEVKSANFLDSEDAKGAVAPRWNFTSNDEEHMLAYLNVPFIYLVSIDRDLQKNVRFRIWKLDPKKQKKFSGRYKEWMKKKGYPKLKKKSTRPSINFQLFPPRNQSDETFARHGNGKVNGFSRLQISLEGNKGSGLIFKATLHKKGLMIDHIIK